MQEKWFQRERTYGNDSGLYSEVSHYPGFEARMAFDLIRAWTVHPEMDGEDSAGRSKGRIMTPVEVARRACDTATALCAEFKDRGWFLPVEVVPNSRG